MTLTRCDWVNDNPLYVAYHDEECGVPVHDDRMLFEMLTLEGVQAGLGWYTILNRELLNIEITCIRRSTSRHLGSRSRSAESDD